MNDHAGGYRPLIELSNEIAKAQDADATIAALAMVYIGLDTLSLLACPINQKKQTRHDFIQ